MNVLFIFLDGVGLGAEDPQFNPLVRARLPRITNLLNGQQLVASAAPFDGKRASLRALDARLGIPGLPQSATGQAALLTGRNIPAEIGEHYGPKPNPAIATAIAGGSLFSSVRKSGSCSAFLNAYPPGYFHAVERGKRMHAAIALAAIHSGLKLADLDDLRAGRAVAADFTGQGLRDRLGISDAPTLTPFEAGQRLAALSRDCEFSLFEHWLPDYAGHEQDMGAACSVLETFDAVLEGLLETWDNQTGLILITSDHGNMEDLSTRRHTLNPVPALVIGDPAPRHAFANRLRALTDVAPAILDIIS